MRIAQAMTLAALLVAGSARAQGRDVTAADALFRDARALMKKGEFDAACPKLVESHQLDPAPGTAINLGDCWEKVGRLADALQVLRDALDLLRAGDHRIPLVKKQVAALEPRVPRLTITLAGAAPDGTKVKRDGIEVGAGSIGSALPVNPGEHTIEVTAPGRESRSFAVTVRAGESRHVEVIPGTHVEASAKPDHRAPPASTTTLASSEPGSDGSTQRTLGFAAIGAGVVVLGAAGIFAIRAASKEGEAQDAGCSGTTCPPGPGQGLSDEADTARETAAWLGGLGSIAAVTGLVLVLTAPSSEHSAITVGPLIVRAGGGAQIGGVW
jgi:hypothetical protein